MPAVCTKVVFEVEASVTEEQDIAGRRSLPVVKGVAQKRSDRIGARFAKAELGIDVVESHCARRQTLGFAESHERLDDGHEIWDYDAGEYTFALTRSSVVGPLRDHVLAFFLGSIVLASLGVV